MTPAERARQIDKEEFAAECAAIRLRALNYVERRRFEARADLAHWLGRPAPVGVFKPVSSPTRRKRAVKAIERTRGLGQNVKRYTYGDNTRTLDQWAEVTGISRHTIRSRLSNGWTLERSLTVPVAAAGRRMHKARPGVVSDLPDANGTGGGSTAQESSEITFSEKAEIA